MGPGRCQGLDIADQIAGPHGVATHEAEKERSNVRRYNGLHMVRAMSLMTVELYNELRGAYLPSVQY